ncbi:MAG: hypothetical protein NZM37_02215 [Sandaracinaceae bacterium]|nr:hypothetical protein [Sandaracinaceae bacterium]
MAESGAHADRLREHLAHCERCRRRYEAIVAYFHLRKEVANSSDPISDWSRIESVLEREAQKLARASFSARSLSPKLPIFWIGASLSCAAAVAFLVWLAPPSEPQAEVVKLETSSPLGPSASPEPPQSAQPKGTPEKGEHRHTRGRFILLLGSVHYFARNEEEQPPALSQTVQGGRIEVETRAQAQLALLPLEDDEGQAVGRIGVASQSAIRLLSADEVDEKASPFAKEGARVEARIELERGRLFVEGFESSSRIVVLAGGYEATIIQARCTIDFESDGGRAEPVISVWPGSEGQVLLVNPQGEHLTLKAGEKWPPSSHSASARTTFAPVEGAPLEISFPRAVQFEVADFRLQGGPNLALQLSPGPIEIRVRDELGHIYQAKRHLDAKGLVLEPSALEPLPPRVQGFLPPEVLTPIVRAGRPALQRCYERILRSHAELLGLTIHLAIMLDSQGTVRTVRLESEEKMSEPKEKAALSELEACIRQEALTWRFPPPGGPMGFEIPLRFSAQ